mmetsp:Transcript_21072/g.31978  ORF Transcript_21072/g.31978 Transcript_21072/m.31978 type:complete len:225 (+) Transcript_21072:41-715(+)
MKSLSKLWLLIAIAVVSITNSFSFTIPMSTKMVKSNAMRHQHSTPALSALLDPLLIADAGTSSPEPIQLAFKAATFFPQPFWTLLVLLPNSGLTKKVMGGIEIVTICCLIHFFIVSASIVIPEGGTAPLDVFNGVFDIAGNPQESFMTLVKYPNFVSEEWSHVLTWDLFLGRWIWLDGLRRGIFTPHSVLLCNLIGPPGLLLHLATCLVTGKGLPGNEAEEEEL